MRILFTNVGRRTYLVEFALAIKIKNIKLRLYLTDTNLETAAFQVSKKTTNFVTPYVNEQPKKYLKNILNICLKNRIDLLIPLIDYDIPILAKNIKKFSSINTKLIVSNFQTVDNCFNKKKNYLFCLNNNIPVPKTFFKKNNIKKFPIIQKKIFGSGSQDNYEIKQKKELSIYDSSKFILQEKVIGQEYGMDILNDFNGNYLHSFIRKKISIKNGETDKAVGINSIKLTNLAKTLSKKFKHIGVMDIDFIITKNKKIFFLDFNARFGGGYPITHLSGYNYLKSIILLQLNRKVIFNKKFKINHFSKGINVYKNITKNKN